MPSSALTVTLVQSTILNAISNILAQVIDQHRKNKPFTLNTLALLQFIAYAIIIVPINFSWQKYLEAKYPGFPTLSGIRRRFPLPFFTSTSSQHNPTPSTITPAEDDLPRTEKDKPFKPKRVAPRSGTYSFIMKFVLDQTVGSVMNIVLFVILINLLKGESLARSWDLVCEDFKPIMIARLKFRPVVSTLMYTVIPLDRRVVFGSACGVIWGVYLSLYAAV